MRMIGTRFPVSPSCPPATVMHRQRISAPMVVSRMNQGDPGLGDFFKGVVRTIGGVVRTAAGVVSGLGIPVVSGVARTVSGALSGGGMQQSSVKMATAQAAGGGPGIQVQLPSIGRGGISMGGFQAGYLPVVPGQGIVPAQQAGTGVACTLRGTHVNKSRYRTLGGELVEAGTRCVKNRRMNPLNPRALNRAMRRIKSAKSAARFLERIHIGARPSRGSARRGGACGCKRRR